MTSRAAILPRASNDLTSVLVLLVERIMEPESLTEREDRPTMGHNSLSLVPVTYSCPGSSYTDQLPGLIVSEKDRSVRREISPER